MKSFYYFLIVFIVLGLSSCSKSDSGDAEPDVKNPDAPQISEAWKSWIQANSHELDIPTSNDYTDLSFLDGLLQNKSLVQLGESTHGAKEFSQSKVRLIKYLHQYLGFNVIAFESSVFDCFYAYNHEMNAGAANLMNNSIFGVWQTQEVKELFDYIIASQNTTNPLVFAGIDIQPSSQGRYARPDFLKEVFSKISNNEADSIYNLDYATVSQGSLAFLPQKDLYIESYQRFYDLLNDNWNTVVNAYPANSLSPHIAKLAVRSAIMYIQEMFHYSNDDGSSAMVTRDSNMAYNVKYLHQHCFPDEKIIVWAHNTHICYNNAQIINSYDEGNTMGYYLKQIYGDDVYSVGFYMYTGQVAMNDRSISDVLSATSNNIEAVLYWSLYDYAFVDLVNQVQGTGNSWMFQNMKAKYWGLTDQTMVIRNQYDALYYVYETSAPSYLSSMKELNNPVYYKGL